MNYFSFHTVSIYLVQFHQFILFNYIYVNQLFYQLFFPEQSDAGDTESEFEYPAGSEFEIYIPYNVRSLTCGSIQIIAIMLKE